VLGPASSTRIALYVPGLRLGTKRRLPVSDAEVLAAYRAGNSQRALALRWKVSRSAVQKAIARAEAREAETEAANVSGEGGAAVGAREMSSREIRERLEHEAVHARDSRTRLSALKMLQELNAEGEGGELSETARRERYAKESGYHFARGALVIERREGRFRAFERTRGGWQAAPVELESLQGRAALLIALVEIFREAPLPADLIPTLGELLTSADRDGTEAGGKLPTRGAELALGDPDLVNAGEETERGIPTGVILYYPPRPE
jgi:hypothetical protein